MNYLIINLVALFSISMTACNKDNTSIVNEVSSDDKLKITVGSSVFMATFYHNASAKALKEMLPLTVNMAELNSNEKYGDLPQNIPTNNYTPNAIKSGDLMLYGTRTLVLFYKNFSSSYSYTRLGKIDNATDLASALGTGNVTVTFEVE